MHIQYYNNFSDWSKKKPEITTTQPKSTGRDYIPDYKIGYNTKNQLVSRETAWDGLGIFISYLDQTTSMSMLSL